MPLPGRTKNHGLLRQFRSCATLCVAASGLLWSLSPLEAAGKKTVRARKPVRSSSQKTPASHERCGPEVVVAYMIRVQNFERESAAEGERLSRKCPAESAEALQWTSFLYAIEGDRERSRIIDRLWVKPPTKKMKSVERNVQLAQAGSPQYLKERLNVFDPAYTVEPKNRWVLGRALARGGDFDGARREYATYLASRPADEAAETEYLYLNIWAGDGKLALSKFREAMLTHTSKDFLAAMERGVRLVYLLWPDLKPNGLLVAAPKPSILPSPSPLASPAISSAPIPPAQVVQASPAPLPSVSPTPSREPKNLIQLGLDQDQVPDLFSLTKITVQTDRLAVNPELYGLRSRFSALKDPSADSAGINLRSEIKLHPTLTTGGHVGWFSAPSGGFVTGRLFFAANVPGDVQIGASVSRRPLALDVPLLKQDLKVTRDAIEAGIGWRQNVSWRGTLEWEGKGIPHERHDGLLRWGFLGDCAKERCLDFFIPMQAERYQTLSPYYYNDEERVGFGTCVMGRLDFDKTFYVKSYGKLMSWQAMPPGAQTENYSTTELSIELGFYDGDTQFSAGYDWRRTSSERTFRKYEVPISIRVNADIEI